MTYDQWMEFLHVVGGCLFVVIVVAAFGIGAAADVSALTSRSKKVNDFEKANLVASGGNKILAIYIWRWWRRRMKRRG